VFLSADAIDITDVAIARIDAAVAPLEETAPEAPAPEAPPAGEPPAQPAP
jgi:hypothetical protein